MAFSAMRAKNQTGMSRNSQRVGHAHATIPATAIEPIAAASVTWFAVTPARASLPTCGCSRSWNAGLKA